MKKIASFGFVVFIALFCISASVWEGAASVSLNGELPEEGYYVATRSFPRNTIVDVTNLETSQTIRVIVASGLDSPGLLAILSKDAAGAIGLHARFVGRIRMTMPSEPVGFSRFTDELDSSGDPDFDPAAAIAAAKDSGFDVKQAVDAIEKDPVKANDTAPGSSPDNAVSPGPKPPIAPNPAASDIVDLPESYTPPQAKTKDGSVKNEPAPAPARPADTATAAGIYGYTPEPVIPPDTSNIARVYPPEYTPERPEPEAAAVTAQTVPPETVPTAITLIPAEQRPPESSPPYQGLPPEAEIAPLKEPGAGYTVQSNVIPDEYIIPPIGSRPSAAAVWTEPAIEPVIPPVNMAVPSPPEVITDVTVVEANPLSADTPALVEKESRTAPAPVPAPETERAAGFSVPVISRLEKGKYYLQLAAYTLPELVETELLKISTVYPLAVQEDGSAGKPLYRILIGPVNLGESGALLQRFKVSGYRDAFIRKEG
ncbi:MAG: SPOR domain-containing protein [Treponema sp.]|jgi:hypothetical protein|nr:SPOR domain-containing protein [Treponema sp.]